MRRFDQAAFEALHTLMYEWHMGEGMPEPVTATARIVDCLWAAGYEVRPVKRVA